VFTVDQRELTDYFNNNEGSGQFRFRIDDNESIPSELENTEINYSVKLLDNMGVVQRNKNHRHRRGNRKTSTKFNTSTLREGTYFLHIEADGELVREQIIIKQ
jgi:hypothetical protein